MNYEIQKVQSHKCTFGGLILDTRNACVEEVNRGYGFGSDLIVSPSTGIGFQSVNPTWRHMRTIFQVELAGSRRLEATKHVRREEAKCMLRAIAQEEGLVNVKAQLNVMISNVISRMILNKRFMGVIKDDTVDLAEAQEFRETTEEIEYLLGAFNISDFIPVLARWDLQGYQQRMEKLHKRIDVFIRKIMAEHQARRQFGPVPECDQDMVDVLLEKLEGDGTSNNQLSENNVKGIIQVRISQVLCLFSAA